MRLFLFYLAASAAQLLFSGFSLCFNNDRGTVFFLSITVEILRFAQNDNRHFCVIARPALQAVATI